MEFSELAFELLNNPRNKVHDCIAWAEQLLENGCDISCVAELASYILESAPDERQVERFFHQCVTELNLKMPDSWEQALAGYIASKCEKLLHGDLMSSRFLAEILILSNTLDDPCVLWIWIDLAGDIQFKDDSIVVCVGPSTFNNALDLKDVDKCIRLTALQFHYLLALDLPDKFPLVWWCENCGAISEESTSTETVQKDCPSCRSAQSTKNMRYFFNRESYIAKIQSPNPVFKFDRLRRHP